MGQMLMTSDEIKTEDDKILALLKQDIGENIEKIQNQTVRKQTIDSITHTVPSSSLNSSVKNDIEANHLEQYQINRRLN